MQEALCICLLNVDVFPRNISHVTQIQQEREELYKAQSIQIVQQKVDTKIELLERRMKSITDSLERKQAQLCSVLSAPNMDQTALAGVAGEVEVPSHHLLLQLLGVIVQSFVLLMHKLLKGRILMKQKIFFLLTEKSGRQ